MTASDVNERQKFIAIALRRARGQYNVTRTSQLSGIPNSTLYEWSRNEVYTADFHDNVPKSWSYRDLVFLRLLAFLRQGGMDRHPASEKVQDLKSQISNGLEVQFLYADRHSLIYEDERIDRRSGHSILPFESISDLFRTFNLLEPIEELSRNHDQLWAPDLRNPSSHTRISPFVMAGDPCITETRIPTSSIHALRSERGLEVEEIIKLFPGLSRASVVDAHQLEQRLRREQPLDRFAA